MFNVLIKNILLMPINMLPKRINLHCKVECMIFTAALGI